MPSIQEVIEKKVLAHKDLSAIGLAFGASVLSKLPELAIQGIVTYSLLETIRGNPEIFIPIGLAAHAAYNVGSVIIGSEALYQKGVNMGIKSTTIFRGLNKLLPQNRRLIAVSTEITDQIINILGGNPLGMLTNITALYMGDPTIILAQRLSANAISGTIGTIGNITLIKGIKTPLFSRRQVE